MAWRPFPLSLGLGLGCEDPAQSWPCAVQSGLSDFVSLSPGEATLKVGESFLAPGSLGLTLEDQIAGTRGLAEAAGVVTRPWVCRQTWF